MQNSVMTRQFGRTVLIPWILIGVGGCSEVLDNFVSMGWDPKPGSSGASGGSNVTEATGGKAADPGAGGAPSAPSEDVSGAAGLPVQATAGAAALPPEVWEPPCETMNASPDRCPNWHPTTVPQAHVLLVVDKSGSMLEAAYAGQTKWSVLTEALADAFDELGRDGFNSPLGLALFPGKEVQTTCEVEACCSVPEEAVNVGIAPPAQSAPEILQVLEETSPGGMTPTAAVLEQALRYYTVGDGASFQGNRSVLLVTDGGPVCNPSLGCEVDECALNLQQQCGDPDANCCAEATARAWCVDWERTVETINKLNSAGVKTAVVGLPGSEPYAEWLTLFAERGEAAPLHSVSTSGGVSELTATLRDLISALGASCLYQLTESPPAGTDWLLDEVALDCKLVPQSGNSNGPTRNWLVDESTDPPTVRLLSTWCEDVDSFNRMDVAVACSEP